MGVIKEFFSDGRQEEFRRKYKRFKNHSAFIYLT